MTSSRTICAVLSPLLCVLGLIAISGCVGTPPPLPPPLADYGDAPDGLPTGYPAGFQQIGAFPALAANDGARSLSEQGAQLGPAITLEGSPLLVNNDLDDGPTGLLVRLISIPPPARLRMSVEAPAGSSGGTYYVNALIDLNMDGDWDGEIQSGVSEWVVQNFRVVIVPGTTQSVMPPEFAFGFRNTLPNPAWMRITLTPVPVPPAWRGTGEFASGEVEDHLVRLPFIAGKQPAIPHITCPPGRFIFPGGVNQISFNCIVTNPGPGGLVTYRLARQTGGVDVQGPTGVLPPGTIVDIAQGGPGGLVAGRFTMPNRGQVILTFLATRTGPNATPSDWTAVAAGVDPPSIVDGKGVTIGYEDSLFAFGFEAEPVEEIE